jgi:hypothetical protein
MNIPERPSESGTPRCAHAQSSRKRTMVATATLFLATAFVLASAPTATAAPAFTNNHTTSVLGLPAPCGDKPGLCPDPSSI